MAGVLFKQKQSEAVHVSMGTMRLGLKPRVIFVYVVQSSHQCEDLQVQNEVRI